MKWELDEFHKDNQGLLIGEIELQKESQFFKKPIFVLNEVTNQPKYYNSSLQQNPYKNWQINFK